MDVINANDFNLYIYLSVSGTDVPIMFCAATELSITINREVKEACPNFSDNVLWRQYYYGVGDYSIDINGQFDKITSEDMGNILIGVTDGVLGADGLPISYGTEFYPESYRYSTLEDAILNATTLKWKATDLETVEYSGSFLVTTSTITANVNDIVRFSSSLQGTGKLNKTLLNL